MYSFTFTSYISENNRLHSFITEITVMSQSVTRYGKNVDLLKISNISLEVKSNFQQFFESGMHEIFD